MKNYLLFSFFILIGLTSCSSNDVFINETNAELSAQEANLILTTVESELNKSEVFDTKIVYKSSKLLKIIGEYYLRATSDDIVTTSLLKKNQKGSLSYYGISCTSKMCSSSSTQCIPKSDGKACTPCNYGTGDCTKTVSSGLTP